MGPVIERNYAGADPMDSLIPGQEPGGAGYYVAKMFPYENTRYDLGGLEHFARSLGILGQGGRDSEIDPVSIPKLIRSRFRDEAGHGFRF